MLPIAAFDMNDVTRLTRAGRLLDATALLQSRLVGGPSTAPPAGDTQRQQPGGHAHQLRLSAFAPRNDQRRPVDVGTDGKAGRPAPDAWCPPIGSFTARSLVNAAGVLDHKLYVPSRHIKSAVPLVVMLHGCTQNPDDFAAGTRMNELAEIHGFLVAYPAQSTAANASRCWNWFKGSEQIRDQGEPSLIADATRQIIAEHNIDPKRVFVAGLSAGGAAAAIMGCTYPDIYAGVGVHSGLACGAASDLPSAFQAMRGGAGRRGARASSSVPTIVFHGRADRTVGASNADEVLDQVVAASGPPTVERGISAAGMTFTRTIRHDHQGRAVSEQWIMDGGGHAWFGGSPKGTYTDPRGPDASREMLRFFGIVSDVI